MTTGRRICVTGATGKAGRVVVRELLEHGYDVVATDPVVAAHDVRAGVIRADLTDYGQATEVLRGAGGIVHLASISPPGLTTPAGAFTANITMNFNVFHAAASLGVQRVVWASGETTPPFGSTRRDLDPEGSPPRYAPVDEDHYPVPATTYALSTVASETIAEHIARWSGIPFVGLRIPGILDMADYERISLCWPDPHARKGSLWSYVDARDLAAACRLGLEAEVTGSHSVIVAAADTVMNKPSARLLAEVFPGVPLIREIGEFETLLAIDRARQTLGYNPRYSWRQY